MSSNSQTINLRALDVLRGTLAMTVLFGHARWLLWAGHADWVRQPHALWELPLAYASAIFRYGHEAVLVFFVLSGFFIHLRAAQAVAEGKPNSFDVRSYFKRRAHRLLAPYCLALLVTLALDLTGRALFPTLYLAHTGDALLDSNFATKGYSAVSMIPALVFLPGSLGSDFGTNGPLWSLAYEVVYYAIYPLWLTVRRGNPWLAFLLIPAVGLALAFLPSDVFPISVLRHYPLWLAGAALAEWTARGRLHHRHWILYGIGFCGGFFAYCALEMQILRLIAAVIFATSAVLVFASLAPRLTNSVTVRGIEALGVRSYTIYIIHFPVLAFFSAWVIERSGGRPLQGWLAFGGSLAALAFALVCFHFCERHFLHPRLRFQITAAPS